MLSIPPHRSFLMVDKDGSGDWASFSAAQVSKSQSIRDLEISPISHISASIDPHIYGETILNLKTQLLKEFRDSESRKSNPWAENDNPKRPAQAFKQTLFSPKSDSDDDVDLSPLKPSYSYNTRSGIGGNSYSHHTKGPNSHSDHSCPT